MNISSSISQIICQAGFPGKIMLKKAYLWPEYNAGNITRIAPVQERSEHIFNYIKRSSIDPINENQVDKIYKTAQYNSNGGLISTPYDYTPGSIFKALA